MARTAAPALAATGVCALLLLPLLVTSVPPLLDYPNHLARMHVLALAGRDPALARIYAPGWALYPNLLMDLLVPPLARLLPLELAGRIFVAGAVLLPVAGTVVLHRAWFQRWSAWSWIGALLAWNAYVAFGLLNYTAGVGVALLSTGWLLRATQCRWPVRTVIAAGCGTACLLCHLFAWVLLLLLLCSCAAAAWRETGRALVPGIAAASLVPLLLYLLLGPARLYVGPGIAGLALRQIAAQGLFADPLRRLAWLLGVFSAPGVGFDWATLLLAAGVPAMAGLRRRLRLHGGAVLALIGLLAAYAVLPQVLIDNNLVYPRLALPLVLVAIAGVSPVLGERSRHAALAGGVLLLAMHAAVMARCWRGQELLLRDLDAAAAAIPPGARVLAVRDGRHSWLPEPGEAGARIIFPGVIAYAHLPALAVVRRDAFWPMVYAAPGKQPLRALPPYDALVQDDGYLPLTRQLSEAYGAVSPCDPLDPDACRLQPEILDWRTRYDYVLRLNNHPGTPVPDPHLALLRETPFAALYRIK